MQLSGGVLDVSKLKYYSARANSGSGFGTGISPRRNRKRALTLTGRLASSWRVEDGEYQVQDVQRFRVGPAEVEARVRSSGADRRPWRAGAH